MPVSSRLGSVYKQQCTKERSAAIRLGESTEGLLQTLTSLILPSAGWPFTVRDCWPVRA